MRQAATGIIIAGVLALGIVQVGGCDHHRAGPTKTESSTPAPDQSKSSNDPANNNTNNSSTAKSSGAEQSQGGDTKFVFSAEKDKNVIKFWCSKVKPKPLTHEGGFNAFTGTASINGDDKTTLRLDVDIDVNTIYTDAAGLTKHLKTPDFFDVKTNPKALFTSTKVEKDGDKHKISGKLTMHGLTNEVSFPAKVGYENGTLTIQSDKFKINRFDWKINYGKGNIIDDVTLEVSINQKRAGLQN